MTLHDLETFLSAYVGCALWSSNDDDGDPLDDQYSADDVAADALDAMRAECRDFIASNAVALVDMSPTQAGHDFWLTRNGHGAGFWDRGLGEVGRRLTDACKPYGSAYLYVGDNGMIYCA